MPHRKIKIGKHSYSISTVIVSVVMVVTAFSFCYALLLRLENRETHEYWPSYETIGKAIGKSKSSVKRYVAGLVEKGLITAEPTSVIMQNGLKKNGNLRYHIRPIREAIEWYTQHQLYLAEMAAERQRAQQQLAEQAEEPPCSPL